ncbi:MAG: hypothetical protein JW759_06845 [Candidatus Coatesbacteria bacterium]|nr:hypothetical protein [Candidatus Coatesbacteria bacterium]
MGPSLAGGKTAPAGPETMTGNAPKLVAGAALAAYCILVYDWFCDSAGLPHIIPPGTGANILRIVALCVLAACFGGLIALNLSALRRILRLALRNKTGGIILAVLVALSFLQRLPFLMKPYAVFESDQAFTGIIAADIAAGRPAPVFQYGQPYLGTLLAHLAALVLPKDAITAAGLMSLAATIYAAFLIVSYCLLRAFVGRTTAALSALYLALSPQALTSTSLNCGTGLPETLLFGACLLLMGLYMMSLREQCPWFLFVALGYIAGLAIFDRELTLYPLLAVVICAALMRRRIPWLRGALWFALAFAVGYLPAIIYDVRTSFSHLSYVVGRVVSSTGYAPVGVAASLKNIVRLTLPTLLGAQFPYTDAPLSSVLSACMTALFAAGFLFLLLQIIREPRAGLSSDSPPVHLAMFLLIVVTFAVFVLSKSRTLIYAHRYLDPCYIAIAFIFGYSVAKIAKRSKPIAASIAVLVISMNVFSTYLLAFEVGPADMRYKYFLKHLEHFRITHLHSGFWCAYLTSFATSGRTLCSPDAGPVLADRIPQLTDSVMRAEQAGFALSPSSQVNVLASYLDGHGISYDFRETTCPLFFNLSQTVRPQDVDLFPAVAINMHSPHNAFIEKKIYAQQDQILPQVIVAAGRKSAAFDLVLELRDNKGRLVWPPAPNEFRVPVSLNPQESRVFSFRARVKDFPFFSGIERKTDFELTAGLAECGTLDFRDRIDREWFVVKPDAAD